MNRLIIVAILGVLMLSCKQEKQGLEKLKSDREVLQKQYMNLADEIELLDTEIAKFDTVKRHVLITTLAVENRTFAHFFEVQGSIEAEKNVILYPETGGVIERIHVNEGDRVKKGDVLIDLDIELIDLQIDELETSLELANTSYDRQKRLWDQNIGSEMQYLQAKNQKESLELRLASLGVQKRKTRIVAPFSGIVDEIWPKVGELTSPATRVVRLLNLEKVYINADVSESYLGTISKGTDVEIYFPAYDSTLKAQVKNLGNFINPNNRTFKIQVDIPNTDNQIKPNLMAYVRVKDFEQINAIIVPDRLIQENPTGGKYIYVAGSNQGITKVKKMPISIGLSYLNKTLVLEGIDANTVLVDKGARSIKSGQTVQVVN